ncbi:hypothetical protein C5S39_09265, partial [Candidatus Methanophagaceae archaeon]
NIVVQNELLLAYGLGYGACAVGYHRQAKALSLNDRNAESLMFATVKVKITTEVI